MARRQQAWTKIKDKEYGIQLLDAETALEYFGLLAKFLGGPFGRLLASNMAKDAAPELLADALKEVGQHFASPEFKTLVFGVLEGAVVKENGKGTVLVQDGNRELLKGHFTGDFGGFLALAWFGIKENYSGFLEGIPGLKNLLKSQAIGPLPLSQPGMTGE